MDRPELPPILHVEKDAVILWDDRLGSILYSNGFFGKPLGLRKADPGNLNRPLVLSLFEALYLIKAKIIKVQLEERILDADEFEQYAKKYYDNFSQKYRVYTFLRGKGYVVRPGMKFGSDFVIYEKGPGIDHSKWVVHVEKDEKELKAIEIVRAGRLAASVKKRYLIATNDTEQKPVFYSFDRVKI